jgi:hypothetical protein
LRCFGEQRFASPEPQGLSEGPAGRATFVISEITFHHRDGSRCQLMAADCRDTVRASSDDGQIAWYAAKTRTACRQAHAEIEVCLYAQRRIEAAYPSQRRPSHEHRIDSGRTAGRQLMERVVVQRQRLFDSVLRLAIKADRAPTAVKDFNLWRFAGG